MDDLQTIGPAFVDMAHRIGMAVAATSDPSGRPRTRVMQPVWVWNGDTLTGLVSTTTTSPKQRHAERMPVVSFTYWHPSQDTCTADCQVVPIRDGSGKARAWEQFLQAPPPAGFDPAIHPEWDDHRSPTFGVWHLHPVRLRVMPGTLMTDGVGDVLTWHTEGSR